MSVRRVAGIAAAAALVQLTGEASAGTEPLGASSATVAIGRPVTLRDGAGTVLRVTLLQFLDPARSTAYRPRSGTRFVAFRLRYTNLGRDTFRAVPAADVTLVDSRGRHYDSTSLQFGSRFQPWPVLAPDLNHGLALRPRQTATGYLGWVVPTSMRPAQLRYTLAGGWPGAAWSLRR